MAKSKIDVGVYITDPVRETLATYYKVSVCWAQMLSMDRHKTSFITCRIAISSCVEYIAGLSVLFFPRFAYINEPVLCSNRDFFSLKHMQDRIRRPHTA